MSAEEIARKELERIKKSTLIKTSIFTVLWIIVIVGLVYSYGFPTGSLVHTIFALLVISALILIIISYNSYATLRTLFSKESDHVRKLYTIKRNALLSKIRDSKPTHRAPARGGLLSAAASGLVKGTYHGLQTKRSKTAKKLLEGPYSSLNNFKKELVKNPHILNV
jgi:phosphate/sulfate permease